VASFAIPVFRHRPGLRSEICRRPLLEEGTCFDDPGKFPSDVKHAIGLHMEVARASLRIGAHQLPAILDVVSPGHLEADF